MKLSFLNCFRPPVVAEEVGEASTKQEKKVKKTFWAKFTFLRKRKGRKCGTLESEVNGRDDNHSVVEEEEDDSMRAVEKEIGVNMAPVEVTEDTSEYNKKVNGRDDNHSVVEEEEDDSTRAVEKEIGVNKAPVEVTEDTSEYNKKELQQVEAEIEATLEEIDETENKIKEIVAAIEAFWKSFEVALQVQ